ncbi:MAG: hypothetical protein ACLTZY_15870 [Alistipes indistinctus]
MKTLREVADELCPYRLEDYDPAIDDMSDEPIRMGWINGFITGAQWREDNPVAADSASDPESDSIELCGLLWDTENLAIGGYGKDGHHYYTWQEAMDAAKSVGKRLPTRYEWVALCDLGSTWDGKRKGRWFGGNHDTDHKGSLFLPAAGLSSSRGPRLSHKDDRYEYQRLLLVLVAVLRRQQRRGLPLLLLGQRLPAELQQSRLRLQRALRAG